MMGCETRCIIRSGNSGISDDLAGISLAKCDLVGYDILKGPPKIIPKEGLMNISMSQIEKMEKEIRDLFSLRVDPRVEYYDDEDSYMRASIAHYGERGRVVCGEECGCYGTPIGEDPFIMVNLPLAIREGICCTLTHEFSHAKIEQSGIMIDWMAVGSMGDPFPGYLSWEIMAMSLERVMCPCMGGSWVHKEFGNEISGYLRGDSSEIDSRFALRTTPMISHRSPGRCGWCGDELPSGRIFWRTDWGALCEHCYLPFDVDIDLMLAKVKNEVDGKPQDPHEVRCLIGSDAR